jgi:hypothetical protein
MDDARDINPMKAFLFALTVICLSAPAILQSALAQDFDAQCSNMRDKVACVCALQYGGQVIRPRDNKRQGWRLLRREAPQSGESPDRERIAFHAKFKMVGWRLRPSPAVQGYLDCMHRHGRK